MKKHYFLLFMLLLPFGVEAVTTAKALPWDGPIAKLTASVTGPIAYGAGVVSLVLFFLSIAFSDDMNTFGRGLIRMCIGVAGLVFANKLLLDLFGVGVTTVDSGTVFLSVVALLFLFSVVLTALQKAVLRFFRTPASQHAVN